MGTAYLTPSQRENWMDRRCDRCRAIGPTVRLYQNNHDGYTLPLCLGCAARRRRYIRRYKRGVAARLAAFGPLERMPRFDAPQGDELPRGSGAWCL